MLNDVETQFIDRLKKRLPAHPLLKLGVGDDAAVLELAKRAECVVTSDLIADGVHFDLQRVEPQRIGRKALAVNLSDLAAMAAEPVAAVVSILLPQQGALDLAEKVYDGLLPLAAEFNTAIAGGDTNCWAGNLVISVTAIGRAGSQGVLTRSGANPGDAILVTGEFGGSRLQKQFEFQPRVREAQLLHERYDLNAGMDVSDGLSLDLARMCVASGCGAILDVDAIPISADAQRWAHESGASRSPLEHALCDGEDFELVLAAPREVADAIVNEQPLGIPVTNVGQFVLETGLWKRNAVGALEPLIAQGFEHS